MRGLHTYASMMVHNSNSYSIWTKGMDRFVYDQLHLTGRENTAQAERVLEMFYALMETSATRSNRFNLKNYIKLQLKKDSK